MSTTERPYRVISEDSLDRTENKVGQLIAQGYVPSGAISVIYIAAPPASNIASRTVYTQAMIAKQKL